MADPLALLIGMGIGIALLVILIGIAIIALGIFLFVFWILMIIDCATRKFKDNTDKVVWIIVIVFLHIIGAIIYYFVIKRKNKH